MAIYRKHPKGPEIDDQVEVVHDPSVWGHLRNITDEEIKARELAAAQQREVKGSLSGKALAHFSAQDAANESRVRAANAWADRADRS